MEKYKLTGNFKFKKTLFGMVLYVEKVDLMAYYGTPDGHIKAPPFYEKATKLEAETIRLFQKLAELRKEENCESV
jgi:hypothetical protein